MPNYSILGVVVHPHLHSRAVLEEEARIGRVDVPHAEQLSEVILLLHPSLQLV